MPAAHPRLRLLGLGGGALVAVAAVIGAMAIGASAASRPTVSVRQTVHVGSRTEPIAVTSKGVALYELTPETTKHLLCTMSSGCLKLWPPLKLAKGAKLTKPAGLKGRLGSFQRNGFDQATLNGHPLYTFSQDHNRAGTAHGDGLMGFGGTWHVFREGASSAPKPGPTPMPTPPPPGY